MTTRFNCYTRRCCSLLYSLFLTRTSQCWGCIYALCLLFCFYARLLALSFLLPSPFCRCNNETASAAIALRTIPTFCCIPKAWQIAFLKCDRLHSWSVTNCIPEAWQIAFLKRDRLRSWSVTNCIPEAWHHTLQLRTHTARLVALR